MASFRTAAFLRSSKKALLVVQAIQTARPYSAWSKIRSPEPTHLGTTAIMTRPFASVSRLSSDDRTAALSKVSSWTMASDDRDAITKTFEFRDFHQAWSFMSEIATTAETMNHHPEWFNVYNRVVVTLTTHDCHGLSEKDISLAETMDACAAKLETNSDDANATTDHPSAPLSFQPTCDLYDEYLDAARVPNVQFQTMGGKSQFCGTAVTIQCFEDNSRIKEIVSTTNGRGKVLVVDGGGSQRCALLGDMVAKLAVGNEWEGIIVYANVRDIEELRTLNIGIMALGSTPRKSVRRGEGQVDLPVQIGNVWCRPGDKVYADENGVLIVD